jgi:uncharacterized spore protein YtfJ
MQVRVRLRISGREAEAPSRREERTMTTKEMDLLEQIGKAEEAFTVRRVFGEPFEKDGVTVIPAARVQGAVGGGGGEAPDGKGGGTGTGFAMNTKPFGVFVMKDGEVSWRPAVDVNRMILGGQIVAIVALLVVRTLMKARAKTAIVETLSES